MIYATTPTRASINKFNENINNLAPPNRTTGAKTALMSAMYDTAQTNDGHRPHQHAQTTEGEKLMMRRSDPNTKLFAAARAGNRELIIEALEEGAGIDDVADGTSESALHIAVARGRDVTAKFLLARGANVNARHHNGRSALAIAAAIGRADLVSLLLEHGADPTNHSLETGSTLAMTIYHGHTNCADLIVNALIVKYEKDPQKLLAYLYLQNSNVMKLCMSEEKYGSSFKSVLKLIHFLVENQIPFPDIYDLLPIYKIDVIKYETYMQDVLDYVKSLPMMRRHSLLKDFPKKINHPLHIFYRLSRHPSAITAFHALIALKNKTDLEVENLNAATDKTKVNKMLYQAAATGDITAAEICLDKGADINESAGFTYQTPLYIAAANGQGAMVDFLISKGAAANHYYGKETAAHIAAQRGHTEVIKVLAKRRTQLSICLKDEYGETTPLKVAIAHGNTETAKALVENQGLNPYEENYRYYSALYYAVYYSQTEVLHLMIDKMMTWDSQKLFAYLYHNQTLRDSIHHAMEYGSNSFPELLRLLDHLITLKTVNDWDYHRTIIFDFLPQGFVFGNSTFKEAILAHVKRLPLEQRLQRYEDMLNPKHVYGHLMHLQRGMRACDATHVGSYLNRALNLKEKTQREVAAKNKKSQAEQQATVIAATISEPEVSEQVQAAPAGIYPARLPENPELHAKVKEYVDEVDVKYPQSFFDRAHPAIKPISSSLVANDVAFTDAELEIKFDNETAPKLEAAEVVTAATADLLALDSEQVNASEPAWIITPPTATSELFATDYAPEEMPGTSTTTIFKSFGEDLLSFPPEATVEIIDAAEQKREEEIGKQLDALPPAPEGKPQIERKKKATRTYA